MIGMKKREARKNKSIFAEKLADIVNISEDIILDTFLIRMLGSREIIIENHKGILQYSDKVVKLKASPENIEVYGDKLELSSISDDIVCIRGTIKKTEFCKE